MSRTTSNKVQFAEVARRLDQQLELADAARAESLDGLSRVRRAKQSGVAREHKRLSLKLGTEHPRVRQLTLRRDRNAELISDIGLAVDRAKAQDTVVGSDAAIVHGRVYSSELKPLAGMSVLVQDAHEKTVAGPARTDTAGYFKLALPARAERDNAHSGRGGLVLTVSGRDGVAVHSRPLKVLPRKGADQYIEIVLDSGQPHQYGPARKSAAARKTAVKKQRAKSKATTTRRKSPPTKKPKGRS